MLYSRSTILYSSLTFQLLFGNEANTPTDPLKGDAARINLFIYKGIILGASPFPFRGPRGSKPQKNEVILLLIRIINHY